MKPIVIEVKGRYEISECSFKEIREAVLHYITKNNTPTVIYLSHNNAIKMSEICSGRQIDIALFNTWEMIRLKIIRVVEFKDTDLLIQ